MSTAKPPLPESVSRFSALRRPGRSALRFVRAARGLLLVALLLSQPLQARTAVSVFGGVLTDNAWEELVLLPWRTNFERPGFFGVTASREVGDAIPTGLGPVRLELEAQLVRQFGLQRHWEVNLPLTCQRRLKTDPLPVQVAEVKLTQGHAHSMVVAAGRWTCPALRLSLRR